MKKGLVVKFFPASDDAALLAALKGANKECFSAKVINIKEGKVDLTVSIGADKANVLRQDVSEKSEIEGVAYFEKCPVKETV